MIMEFGDLVSVIIPVFNTKQYLVESLDSVINQTYTNLEIIVIDDGSTDGSAEICDDYGNKDKRILTFHQKNSGLSAARNAGLDMLTGEAVAFLDSDDVYHPSFVSTMVSAMVQERADIVTCKYATRKTTKKMVFSDREKAMPHSVQGIYDRESALRSLIDIKDYSAWNKIYIKELWSDIRYPVGHVYEDIDTTYRVINCSNKVAVLNKVLYLKRKHSESITSNRTTKNEYDGILAFSHFVSFVENNTPNIFAMNQLTSCQTSLINKMIGYYVRHLDGMNEIKPFEKQLKKQIDNVGIKNLGLLTRIGYYMICSCPRLLKLMVPIYAPIRRFVWRIIRR